MNCSSYSCESTWWKCSSLLCLYFCIKFPQNIVQFLRRYCLPVKGNCSFSFPFLKAIKAPFGCSFGVTALALSSILFTCSWPRSEFWLLPLSKISMLKLISKIEFVLKGSYNNCSPKTRTQLWTLLNFSHHLVKLGKCTGQRGGKIAQSYWLIDRVCWHLIGYHVFANVFAAWQNSLSPAVLSFATR